MMKKLNSLIVYFFVIILIGCQGSNNDAPVGTSSNNNLKVISPNIDIFTEYHEKAKAVNLLKNVIDEDNSTLNVLSVVQSNGDMGLPKGYYLSANKLIIDSRDIYLDYGDNLTYDFNVTVSNEKNNVTYTVHSVIEKHPYGGGEGSCAFYYESTDTSSKENLKVVTPNIDIVMFEGSTAIVLNLLENVSNENNSTLSVTSVVQSNGDMGLPEGSSLGGYNLIIDSSNIDVPDGVNLAYDFNVTISDGENNVTYTVHSVIQDSENDGMIVASDITSAPKVLLGHDLNLSLNITDTDGVESVSYTLYRIHYSCNSIGFQVMRNGVLVDNIANGTYTAVITTKDLDKAHYRIDVTAIGNIGGKNPNSEIDIYHSFDIIDNDSPTIITKPIFESKSDTTINTTVGTFTDTDGIRNLTVSLYLDIALINFVDTNIDGNFTGLTPNTRYFLATSGEALNGETNVWEVKTATRTIVTLPFPID